MIDVCRVFNKLAVVELIKMFIGMELFLQLFCLLTYLVAVNFVFLWSISQSNYIENTLK